MVCVGATHVDNYLNYMNYFAVLLNYLKALAWVKFVCSKVLRKKIESLHILVALYYVRYLNSDKIDF